MDLPPRILVSLYEQYLRDEAERRLGNLNDLQAAIASAFGGEAASAVEEYKRALEAVSGGSPEGGDAYTHQQHPDAIPL